MTMKMSCPKCGVRFKIQETRTIGISTKTTYVDYDRFFSGYVIEGFLCPDCNELIIKLHEGWLLGDEGHLYLDPNDTAISKTIYPKPTGAELSPVIPEKYKKDFNEATGILPISPKASAAMSRTMLQTILREEYGIKKKNLFLEIEEFITLQNVPSYITDSVDAIRIIGNLAAHPQKSNQTGDIMEVEDGEAEWLLEVLEALFDFTFVQPVKLQERKEKLNAKLRELGKKEMLA